MMRVLPSGSTALLVEVGDLDEVLGLYPPLVAARIPGVVDIVPAATTVLVVADTSMTSLAEVEAAVRAVEPDPDRHVDEEVVEIPVAYDGEDLQEVASLLDCDADEVIRRHREADWRVAFCGFAPGFGYLTSASWDCDVPRRTSPRKRVPAGAVALAGAFSGVYPRESPGGWQLIGSTDLRVFDPEREPPALLRPGVTVRFVEAGQP